MAWVALAGPLTNLMLAAVSALVYRMVVLLFSVGAASGILGLLLHPLYHMARFSVVFNLVLMAVNLFPVPPLDGGRVLMGFLPRTLAFQVARLERYGMVIVLLFMVTGWWGFVLRPVVNLFARILL